MRSKEMDKRTILSENCIRRIPNSSFGGFCLSKTHFANMDSQHGMKLNFSTLRNITYLLRNSEEMVVYRRKSKLESK